MVFALPVWADLAAVGRDGGSRLNDMVELAISIR